MTEFASFDCWYRFQRAPPISIELPLPPRFPPFLPKYLASSFLEGLRRAPEEWWTMRASPRRVAAFSRRGRSSRHMMKCERWFVCIWMSQPSSVALSSMAMIPALLQSTSSPCSPTSWFTCWQAARTDLKLIRSHATVVTLACGKSFLMASSASVARCDRRLSIRTCAPTLAIALAATNPVPVVQPVTTTTLPSMRDIFWRKPT
mmetsp:Transcript_29235/g.66917  ORF Transcript_29235/g.66917 Transcript_29235/m.66917 type:complete len:204 (+) Transcript_29235:435-1046(+)